MNTTTIMHIVTDVMPTVIIAIALAAIAIRGANFAIRTVMKATRDAPIHSGMKHLSKAEADRRAWNSNQYAHEVMTRKIDAVYEECAQLREMIHHLQVAGDRWNRRLDYLDDQVDALEERASMTTWQRMKEKVARR